MQRKVLRKIVKKKSEKPASRSQYPNNRLTENMGNGNSIRESLNSKMCFKGERKTHTHPAKCSTMKLQNTEDKEKHQAASRNMKWFTHK